MVSRKVAPEPWRPFPLAALSCGTHVYDARLEVFRDAVRQNATAIVAVHNHPSGDPTPSAADVALTVEIAAAGRLLDVELLDHLIIGQGRWVSLKRLEFAGDRESAAPLP